jgi:N-acetylneuraminic acid mutarotase
MKIYYLSFIFFLQVIISNGQTWFQRASFPGPYGTTRQAAISVSVGSKGYVGLGIDAQGTTNWLKDFWEYNAVTNSWRRLPDFPGTGRLDAMAFVIGSNIYVGGGNQGNSRFIGSYLTDFYVFNTATETWSTTTAFPGGPRGEAFAFSMGGKGYVSCGKGTNASGYTHHTDLWAFDPSTASWTRKADLPQGARVFPIGFVINGKAYVGGGIMRTGVLSPVYTYYGDFWEYNPATDAWARKADMPEVGLWDPISVGTCSKGYVIGGWTQSGTKSNKTLEFDAITNTWRQIANFPYPTGSSEGWIINGHLYGFLGGGATLYALNLYGQYNIIPSSPVVCSMSTLTFQNPPANSSVSWASSNSNALRLGRIYGQPNTIVTASRVNNFNGSVTVTATVTEQNGCTSSYSKTIQVGTFLSTPIVGQAAVCPGNSYNYSVTVPGGHHSNYTYQWTVPSGWSIQSQSANNMQLYVPTYNTSYGALQVRVNNGCGSNQDGITVYPGYGCPGSYYFIISPNPVSGGLLSVNIVQENNEIAGVVDKKQNSEPVYTVELFNSDGYKVFGKKCEGNDLSLPTSNYPKGSYILKIFHNKEVITERILIQ